MLARGVKVQLASGSEQRVAVKNDNAFTLLARKPLQAPAQFNFLSGE